jgi:hypothetical protein
VTIRLPRSLDTPILEPERQQVTGAGTVLLVEDNPDVASAS